MFLVLCEDGAAEGDGDAALPDFLIILVRAPKFTEKQIDRK